MSFATRLLPVLLMILPFLAPASKALASDCSPASASITYEADDFLKLWLNGNMVVDGTQHDPGAPPLTIPVSSAYFSPAGTPNFFAAEVINDAANLVGGAWQITMYCNGGGTSYLSSADGTYSMYDDVSGGAPPPADWISSGASDLGTLFSSTAIQAPASSIFWLNPGIIDHATGVSMTVLSHSSAAIQGGLHEILYFRQSIVIPTPPPTPTPYPTVCGGPPVFEQSSVVAKGCFGNGNPTSFPFTVPANNPGQILLVQLETTGAVPTAATYNGTDLTVLPGSPLAISIGGNLCTYYMPSPPMGSNTLAFTVAGGCSWNIIATLYQNVDLSSPFGTIATSSGNAKNFVDNISITSPYSVIHDLVVFGTASTIVAATGTELFPAGASGGSNQVYGSYFNATAPVSYNLSYTADSPHAWNGQSIELKARTNCNGTPTDTPTPVPTFTFTSTMSPSPLPGSPTYTFTITPTRTFTPTPPPTGTFTITLTQTPYFSPTVSPTITVTKTPYTAPERFKVVTIYPNPMPEEGGYFVVGLPLPGKVIFRLYDLRGELVWHDEHTYASAGTYQYLWEAKNQSGAKVSYGSYFLSASVDYGVSGESDSRWLSVLR